MCKTAFTNVYVFDVRLKPGGVSVHLMCSRSEINPCQ